MRTRSPAPRAVHIVAATCVFALTALSLTSCKGRADDDAAATSADTAAPPAATMAPAGDTAASVAAPTPEAVPAATPPAAKPAAEKPPAAKPPAAKTAAAEPASVPAPKPAKVYPPFDPNASASAIGVSVYPKEGQSIEQQHGEENECFAWAKTNTGIDPTAPAPAQAAGAPVPKGGAVRGAAKGAVAGVAIGAIAGDAGKGAAIGATAGAIGGRRARKSASAQAEVAGEKQAAASQNAKLGELKKSMSVCLEGRGYSAK
jgi:hypothetical protein